MKKIVHYIGLDVHKDSIAVAIAPEGTTEVRSYGIIGGTLKGGGPIDLRFLVITESGNVPGGAHLQSVGDPSMRIQILRQILNLWD